MQIYVSVRVSITSLCAGSGHRPTNPSRWSTNTSRLSVNAHSLCTCVFPFHMYDRDPLRQAQRV